MTHPDIQTIAFVSLSTSTGFLPPSLRGCRCGVQDLLMVVSSGLYGRMSFLPLTLSIHPGLGPARDIPLACGLPWLSLSPVSRSQRHPLLRGRENRIVSEFTINSIQELHSSPQYTGKPLSYSINDGNDKGKSQYLQSLINTLPSLVPCLWEMGDTR